MDLLRDKCGEEIVERCYHMGAVCPYEADTCKALMGCHPAHYGEQGFYYMLGAFSGGVVAGVLYMEREYCTKIEWYNGQQ